MDVTVADINKIPARNLRVSRAEFAALWTTAERLQAVQNDWYAAGVVMTCRWLAGATVRPRQGRPYMAFAPVTERSASAYEELIEAELRAAETMSLRRPMPTRLQSRPGWLDAVIATLNWAWHHSGQPPMPFEQPTAAL